MLKHIPSIDRDTSLYLSPSSTLPTSASLSLALPPADAAALLYLAGRGGAVIGSGNWSSSSFSQVRGRLGGGDFFDVAGAA